MDTTLDTTISSLSNFIPMGCVLVTHWKNVGSTGKFIRLLNNFKQSFSGRLNSLEGDSLEKRETVVNNDLLIYLSEYSDDQDIDVTKVMSNIYSRMSRNITLIKSNSNSPQDAHKSV